MTACPSTTRTVLTRTGALAVVFGTAFGLAIGPAGLALAQDVPFSTVRAVIDQDGSVESVERIGSDEEAGELPVTVRIAESGGTTSYTVENTTVEKQTISYLGAEGKPTTSEVDIALPLVAQLSVLLPESRTDVSATGARITRLADGSTELVWSMVLFGPIGSPVQDVSFTSGGSGDPVARLAVQAVQPNATPGLSAVGQAANATVNGNGILTTVANGADNGLGQLSDGVGQLLTGLDKLYAGAQQLNSGIVDAVDGAEQLADGSEAAKAGSGKLAGGLGELAAGADELSIGAGKVDAGTGKVVEGLGTANGGGTKLAAGGKELSTGATAAAAGAKSLSDGLTLISGGLDQLSAAQGLPAALDGAKKLQVGVDALRAGLGAPTTDGTILNGVAKISAGLAGVQAGMGQLSGGLAPAQTQVLASRDDLTAKLTSPTGDLIRLQLGARGISNGLASLCATAATLPADPFAVGFSAQCAFVSPSAPGLVIGSDAVADGVDNVVTSTTTSRDGLTALAAGLGQALGGINNLSFGITQLQNGTKQLDGGLKQVAGGLESGDPAKPGIAEGLDALVAGLTTAVGGVTQLATGAKTAAAGSTALADGNAKIAAGATALSAGTTQLSGGLTQLYTGGQELKAGTGALSAGSVKLAAGADQAAAGAGELDAGLAKIADGQRKVADGLPAAADGSGQIADGLGQAVDGGQKVKQGLSDVRTQAVGVLKSQFAQGTELARLQLAGLDAASARITDLPGAATTTWVLAQGSDGSIQADLASGDSDLGRNVAVGLGGALLLLGGVAGGYLSGRRKATV